MVYLKDDPNAQSRLPMVAEHSTVGCKPERYGRHMIVEPREKHSAADGESNQAYVAKKADSAQLQCGPMSVIGGFSREGLAHFGATRDELQVARFKNSTT